MRSLGGLAPKTELGMIIGAANAAPIPVAIELLRKSRRVNIFNFFVNFDFTVLTYLSN
jgi:hypothetical protein